MAEHTTEAVRAREAQEYDEGNPTLLDRLESLERRVEALERETEEHDMQRHIDRTEGMSY